MSRKVCKMKQGLLLLCCMIAATGCKQAPPAQMCPAGIKNVFDIHLSVDKRTPFSSRTAPEFSAYFHQIWKELS